MASITASAALWVCSPTLAQAVKPVAAPASAAVASKPVVKPGSVAASAPAQTKASSPTPATAPVKPVARLPASVSASASAPITAAKKTPTPTPTKVDAASKPVAPTAAVAASKPIAVKSKLSVLDERAQALKREIQQLNQELEAIEKSVMFPPSGQVAVLISMGSVKGFALESIEVKSGDKVLTQHLYSAAEQAALLRGGVQRLYVSAVPVGGQEWQVSLSGKGPQDRSVKRVVPVKFEKGPEPKYVQVRIEDTGHQSQPDMAVKVWQ